MEQFVKNTIVNRGIVTAILLSASLFVGCGGTKVLKEPQPLQTTQPLAKTADQRVSAILDWVIVREGPGTWARNADWDEYQLRVRNLSDQPVKITQLMIVDSLNTPIGPQPGRKKLVKGSKETARRYKRSGVKVKAGRGAGTMLVAGAAVTAVGVASASAIAATSALSGAAAGAGGAGAAVGGLLLLGPALAVGGVVRGVNNSAVNTQIETRQTAFPLDVSGMEEAALDVFFPLAPSPRSVELTYTDTSGEHLLTIDTRSALNGLHIDAPRASAASTD
jgi:hypothetical protein